MAKISRSGKKKHSQYRLSARERAVAPKIATAKEKEREKKRLRYNGTALAMLTVSLILVLFAPKLDHMGFSYDLATGIAYSLAIVSGIIMFMSVKYTKEEKKTSSTITGVFMVLIGVIGMAYVLLSRIPFMK